MGHGIAQIFALKGYKVKLFDNDPKALQSAPEKIRNNLQTLLEMHLVESQEIEDCLNHLQLCHTLTEMCEGVELTIEAVSEKVDLKRAIFLDLERLTPPQTIMCSNTSGISIGLISENLRFKERVIGTHFWNPPHIVPCVEVIKSQFTADEVFHTVIELMERVGKKPVRVLKDIPGFLGNRLQHALWREAISLVEKGIAAPEDIDSVVKFGFGLRLPFIGPLETADLALYVSEMITARALVEGNAKTLRLAAFAPDEKPRSLQLYGVDPLYVGEAVARLVGEGHVDHIDMNFGCPVRKVTSKGGGAALPLKPNLLRGIVSAAVKNAGSTPITIKFRKGISDDLLTFRETGRIAEGEGCAAIALHARTAAQLYDGEADWNAISDLKETVRTIPVLGNGDIWEAHHALRMSTSSVAGPTPSAFVG